MMKIKTLKSLLIMGRSTQFPVVVSVPSINLPYIESIHWVDSNLKMYQG